MPRGIDYGLGRTNIDEETGIRYGVISPNEVLQAWADSSEADYGPPTCGKCGNELDVYDDEKHGEYPEIRGCCDFACKSCGVAVDSSDAYGEEPNGFYFDDDEIRAIQGSDGDIFILKSPYYTKAAFCSPCAPGACCLTDPCEDGEKAYCFDGSWFSGGIAPYPVYSVATDELVPPEKEIA